MKPTTAFLALAVAGLLGGPAAAQSPQVAAPQALPVIYQATKLNVGGTSMQVLLPRPLDRFDSSRFLESLLGVFDILKAGHPYEYGKAALLLDPESAKGRRATLALDPERRDSHDLVASEVFHSLRSLGVTEVRAPLLRETPLDSSALRTPVFLMTVPYYDALPPHAYANVVVVLSPVDVMPSDLFYQRLRQGDKDLVEKVLGGLAQPSETVRLAVLAAFPNLWVDRRSARLLPLLSDRSVAVRMSVLKLLEGETSKEVNDRLAQVVETDQDPSMKLQAVRMLSARGMKKYDVFIEMEKLADRNDDVVLAAVGRLAASKNPVVAPSLAQALRHGSRQRGA